MLNKVLVPLDGSELAERALEYALKIVANDGTLFLLQVVYVPDEIVTGAYTIPMTVPSSNYEQAVSQALEHAEAYLKEIKLKIEEADLTIELITEYGEAASLITEVAKERDVDAIVISTHGRSGVGKWLFGSVTQRVLNALPCPIFVIPGRQQSPEFKKTDTAEMYIG